MGTAWVRFRIKSLSLRSTLNLASNIEVNFIIAVVRVILHSIE